MGGSTLLHPATGTVGHWEFMFTGLVRCGGVIVVNKVCVWKEGGGQCPVMVASFGNVPPDGQRRAVLSPTV